jgi:hypothetical protein
VLYDNRLAYGYRPVPDQTRRRLRGARVHINGLGVRGPDVGPRRPPEALRILFLGDSVTYGGSYVDDTELFSAVAARALARRLPGHRGPVEPLNAGVNAWGPQNILGLVRDGVFRSGFESQLWVVTVADDDFRREKTRIGEVPYFNAPPRTAWEEVVVLAAYRILTAYKRPKPPEDVLRLGRENLEAYRAIADAARAADARVLFVWHPAEAALRGPPEPNAAALGAMARDASVSLLDLGPVYARERDPSRLYADGLHLSVAGHLVAGRAIGERLGELAAAGGA